MYKNRCYGCEPKPPIHASFSTIRNISASHRGLGLKTIPHSKFVLIPPVNSKNRLPALDALVAILVHSIQPHDLAAFRTQKSPFLATRHRQFNNPTQQWAPARPTSFLNLELKHARSHQRFRTPSFPCPSTEQPVLRKPLHRGDRVLARSPTSVTMVRVIREGGLNMMREPLCY